MSKRNIKNHGKRKPHGKQVSLTPDKSTNVQRKHKDTLFRFIFRDRKKLLQLYNALNQSGYEDEEGRYLPPVAMECKVLVLNINYGNNQAFLEMCRPLMAYSLFVHKIRENISAGHEPSEAVNLAVDTCISQGILTDVLKGHRREVVAMFLEDYDEELYHKMVRKEGYEEGAEAKQEQISTLYKRLLQENRQNEIGRAMTDFEFQEQLMKKYGI